MTLTRRQEHVAALLAEGRQDKQIAGILGIRVRTVRWHIDGIARAWRLDPRLDKRILIALRFDRRTRPFDSSPELRTR